MTWTPAWTDFVICLLTGWLGVHKFREHKTGIGILYLLTLGLFGIGWIIDCIRYLTAAINGERIQGNRPNELDVSGPLPIVQSNLVLADGETCHYCGAATFVKTKNVVVGYSGGHAGASIRVAKGMSIRTGSTKASPIRGDVQERTNGVLSITNKRVVFSANKVLSTRRFPLFQRSLPTVMVLLSSSVILNTHWNPKSRIMSIRS